MSFVELPGAYLDAIVMEVASGLAVINRNPDTNETGALVTTNIALDIADLTALGIDLAATDVFINGTLAYDGATDTFQTGFDGPASARTAPDADTTRITIDPTTSFTSEQVVTVRVVADTAGGGNAIDISYTFTVQDLTPPALVSAEPRDLKTVRVTFSEPVLQVSAGGVNDSRNPSNWTFTPTTFPAVTPTVASVTVVSTTVVDLVTNIDISPGRSYTITATAIADLLGNLTASPTNQVSFVGFVPPKPAGRRWNLIEFIPQMNREEDVTQELAQFVACLQEVTDLLLFDIDRFTDILDHNIAPEPFLTAILCDLGNPFAFEDLSEIDKRRLVDVLVSIYKQKGTAVGVINAIRFFLGIEVTIDAFNATGWILGEDELGETTILAPGLSSEKYSFTIISPVALTAEQRTRIKFIVDFMKPAHTHCIDVIEPTTDIIDHWELGLSELGDTTDLH